MSLRLTISGLNDLLRSTFMTGRVVWKIDYYNRTLDGGSDDPTGPNRTCRVLTIMLAREW